MKTIAVIQPSEMGADFKFENGYWNVVFPEGVQPPPSVSTDANNALVKGEDNGAFLDKGLLLAYAMVQDNTTKKINLYSFPAGTVFAEETATLVSSVDMIELNGVFDDIAIADGVLTFTDADTGLTLTLDTKTLQRISDITAGDGVAVDELNGVVTLSVKIADTGDNLASVGPEGLQVSGANVVRHLNENRFNQQRHEVDIVDESGPLIKHTVGNEELTIPAIMLVNSAGENIGVVFDPAQATLTSNRPA